MTNSTHYIKLTYSMRKFCSKVVVENFFEPCLLYLLLQKPSYGYELFNNLKNNCECNVNIGNLYRALSRLQKEEYILKKKSESKIGPDRTVYEIKDKGRKLLQEWITELEIQIVTINKLVKNYKNIYETHI